MEGTTMTIKLLLFLVIGTILMGIPIWRVSKEYQIAARKSIATTVVLTIVGTVGTFLMFALENGHFGGLSFYGAVFLVPVVFTVVAPLFHITYGKVMDLCAIGECIMLALMKIHCMISGCCSGRVLFTTASGVAILFPSRGAELLTALVIFVLLLKWALNREHGGMLYAWYMVIYGSARFVLNIFREAWVVKEQLLPYGNIWSLVSVLVGSVLVVMVGRQKSAKNLEDNPD